MTLLNPSSRLDGHGAAPFYVKCNYLKSYLCSVPIKLYGEEAGCRGRIRGQHEAAATGWCNHLASWQKLFDHLVLI